MIAGLYLLSAACVVGAFMLRRQPQDRRTTNVIKRQATGRKVVA